MRSLYAFALLLLVAGLSAADYQTLTLRDGRHLVGFYDEAAGTLRMVNPAAVMHVDRADVVSAEATIEPEAKPAAPAAAAKPAPDKPKGDPATLVAWREAQARCEQLEHEHEDATRSRGEAAAAALEDLLKRIDLTPIPNATAPDASPAVLAQALKVSQFNEQLAVIRAQPPAQRRASDAFLRTYAELRGERWIIAVIETPGRRTGAR